MTSEEIMKTETLKSWTKGNLIDMLMFFRHNDQKGYIKLRNEYEENMRGD